MDTSYTRQINQYKLKDQTVFSARLDKQVEDTQVIDEGALFINLNPNQKITESHFDTFDNKSPFQQQTQAKERKNSGWRFDKINSMILHFKKLLKLLVDLMCNHIIYKKWPIDWIINGLHSFEFKFYWRKLRYWINLWSNGYSSCWYVF